MPDLMLVIIMMVVVFVATAAFLVYKNVRKNKQSKGYLKRSVFDLPADGESKTFDSAVKHNSHFGPTESIGGRGRLYAFAVAIMAIFGTIAMRLWSLQLISVEEYRKAASQNMTADASIPATRGRVLDRNGKELIGNRPSLCVMAPRHMADNPLVVHMLSLILGIPKGVVKRNILDETQGAQANRLIARDVPMHTVAFIKEHHELFSEIEIVERTIRTYPYGQAGAHVLGYIGPVTQFDLDKPQEGIIYEGGDTVGKDGAEAAFEKVLQGVRGVRTFRVDADGNTQYLEDETAPVNGSDVCLTIDIELQKATDQILADVMVSSHMRGFPYANAGALVCLDIEDGGILASTSYPSFNPELLANTADEEVWDDLLSGDTDQPLFNRVIAGEYAAASTFKAFSSLAGLKNGIIGGDTYHNCTGVWDEYGEQWAQRCWIYPNGHGYLGLEEAINQSCDVFFYSVGAAFWQRWNDEPADTRTNPLQDYLRTWGFGASTGVDMVGESVGRVPDAAWKKEAFDVTPEDAVWRPGDMTSMCIGQGDLLVTPLQLANAYAGLARQKMFKPHLLHSVLNSEGKPIIEYTIQESIVQPEFDDYSMSRVKDGLQRVVNRVGGKFNQLPVQAAGKTGTAEVASAMADFSWFVGYAPAGDPKYCVACLVEQAGDGSSAALLGVQHTFAAIYGVDVGDVIVEKGSRE